MTSAAPRRAEAGFSLIEAMIATLVFAFGIVSVLNLFTVSTISNAQANAGSAAAVAASTKLSELRARAFTVLVPSSGVEEVVVPGAVTVRLGWTIEPVNARTVFIVVVADTPGFFGNRIQTRLTSLRTCASDEAPCPVG